MFFNICKEFYNNVLFNLKQEALQTFQFSNGGVIEEKVTVTDTSVDVTVPNKIKRVIDYERVTLYN